MSVTTADKGSEIKVKLTKLSREIGALGALMEINKELLAKTQPYYTLEEVLSILTKVKEKYEGS